MSAPSEGDSLTIERTFTHEDVRQFAEVSGDDQPRHREPDEDGRLMVQGLLTATLPTRIGGDLHVLARTMTFEFHRPVYTGETITCEMEVDDVAEREGRYDFAATITCANEDGAVVLTGSVEGQVPKPGG